MATYRVTCVYIVQAPCKGAALTMVQDPTTVGELLDYVSVRDVPDQKPQGWTSIVRDQLLGPPKAVTQQPAGRESRS